MTSERWAAMSDDERNVCVAETIFGDKIHPDWRVFGKPKEWLVDSETCEGKWIDVPDFVGSHALAWQVEEKIRELGLVCQYVWQLTPHHLVEDRFQCVFAMVHATPDSRCLAAVIAKEGVE